MTSNFRSFAAALDKFEDSIEEQADLIRSKISFEALASVIQMTPVDTGRARGNWQTSVNVAIDTEIDVKDKRGSSAQVKGQEVISAAPTYGIVWISNALPYINELEFGSSKQAPEGMVAITVARLQQKYGLT